MNMSSKSKLFLILALHRSGSSAVAGVLDLLGVDMGDNLLPATPANPKGFFENIDVVLLNDKILERLSMTWYAPRLRREILTSKSQLTESKLLLEKHINLFRKEKKSIWGLKDPRMLLTLDVWKSYLEEFSKVTYIFVNRPLEESVKSLSYRDNINLNQATKILNIYYKNLIYYRTELLGQKKDIIDINFKNLLEEPEIFVKKMNCRLNQDDDYNLDLIKIFLDIRLKNF
ncbi:sulfotransferase family protein [Bacillus thuringiensis]